MTLSPSINALVPNPKMKHVTSSLVVPGLYFNDQHAGSICYQLRVWGHFEALLSTAECSPAQSSLHEKFKLPTRLRASSQVDIHLLG